ncbi:ankyrin [Aspergillus ibericus CBS 121593]|uniref:Ankyrin n=1 Tax=Aspergillus ibericus CBS 121593 TaxID=1448316 RepID=A0A395H943_9EURO|nr:ankyrin [Aspergillus ibericus CBS 121593]RAL04471.1 ankyrin [Aspergillus ibericus CBS 121593]
MSFIMETPVSLEFLQAARERDFRRINALILAGKSINASDKDGYTALHRAAIQNPEDLNTISILISYGAIKDTVHEEEQAGRYRTPLHYAAIQGNVELVALLLNMGADPAPQHLKDWRTPLEDAISNGHVSVVEKMIQCFIYGSLGYRPSKGLAEAIILASRLWYSDVLILLLEYRNRFLPSGTIPQMVLKQALCEAIQAEACGVSMQPFDERIGEPGDHTPTKVADLLIRAGINFKPEELDRLLSTTCRNSNLIGVTRLLLNLEATVTSYHIVCAIESRNIHMVKLLIPPFITNGGQSSTGADEPDLVQYAAGHGTPEMFEYLYETFDAPKRSGSLHRPRPRRTPLIHYAVWGLQREMIKYLLDTARSHVHETDDLGHTPLMYAFDDIDTTKERTRLPVLQLLIEQGSDVRARSTDGLTALHLAVRMGSIDIVRLLLNKGSDPNAKAMSCDSVYLKRNPVCRDPTGILYSRTPLHWAVDPLATVSLDVVRALLRFGADVNEPDGNNATPLNILLGDGWGDQVWEPRAAVAELLMKYGADADIEDKMGRTARDHGLVLGVGWGWNWVGEFRDCFGLDL